jgi:DNA polymerase
MKLIILDGESYYDDEYSLKRLDPASYILDPRFELIGIAVKEPGSAGYWVEGPDAPAFFAGLDPDGTATVSHNALFDNCVWAWRYGFVPRLMVDTLGVSRAVLSLKDNSLASVAEHLGLGAKGKEIALAKGMHLADLKADPELYQAYINYALNDTALCEGILDALVRCGKFPNEELFVQDLVLRCAVTPTLRADVPMLQRHLEDLRDAKQSLLNECGYDRAALMSSDKFCKALESLGVTVETKVSPTDPDKYIPAIAKTDEFMAGLAQYQDADDDTNFKVQTLVSARLAHKSTLEETRSEKFIAVASLPWPNRQPMLPMPLRYGGARTHRLSGTWSMNLQNLARDTTRSKLRKGLIPPAGYKIITADMSQIEARLVAQLCGQSELVEAFRDGVDVYADFASDVFGQPVTEKEQPDLRFIGKTGVLSLGYGCGPETFHRKTIIQARQFGITLDGLFDEEVAKVTVNTYRHRFDRIPAMWRDLDDILRDVLMTTDGKEEKLGPVTIMPGRIRLPNGLFLRYDDPDEELWGGWLLEHLCQALARVIIMQAALRLNRRGHRFIHQVHDELVFCVPDDQIEEAKTIITQEMTRPPAWLPELPLAAEVKIGGDYGSCA